MNRRVCLIVLVFFFASNPAGSVHAADGSSEPIRILFIGNSYTAQIKDALRSALEIVAQPGPELEFITKGGQTLAGHLDTPKTLETIATGRWDFVVLQEQSLTPAYREPYFQDSVKRFDPIIRDAGATPVLYMTWERRDREEYDGMGAKLSAAYRKAADATKSKLVPAGDTWAAFRDAHPDLASDLYKNDGSHPSKLGGYLVACTFLRSFSDRAMKELQIPTGVPKAQAVLVRKHVAAQR